MILDMNYWRNKLEEEFWVNSYLELVKSNRSLVHTNPHDQRQKFSKWLQEKGIRVIHDTTTIVVEIPDEDYMLMYLTHENP